MEKQVGLVQIEGMFGDSGFYKSKDRYLTEIRTENVSIRQFTPIIMFLPEEK